MTDSPSPSPAPTPIRLGQIQTEAMTTAELFDVADSAASIIITRPFGADPLVLVAVPEAGIPAVTAVVRALRSAAEPDP